MRLVTDIYFDGERDLEDMAEGLSGLIKEFGLKYIQDDDIEPWTLVLPLGRIVLTKEPNRVEDISNGRKGKEE